MSDPRTNAPPTEALHNRLRTWVWEASPLLALAVGMLMTAHLARSEWERTEAVSLGRFRQHCLDFVNLFDKSLRLQLQAVLNLREWCSIRPDMPTDDWESHILKLHLPADYSPVLLMGFAELVLDSDPTDHPNLENHLKKVRANHGPLYRLTLPPGGSAGSSWYQFPITHASYSRRRNEPPRVFQRYGMDLNQNPDLWAAINWSMGQDVPSVSGLQPISPDSPNRRGVYLFHTVYRPGFNHEFEQRRNLGEFPQAKTPTQIAEAERLVSYRSRCRGVVFATIDMEVLLKELIAQYGPSTLFACYASTSQQPSTALEQCLFDNRPESAPSQVVDVPRTLFGRTFLLRFVRPNEGLYSASARASLWIGALGTLFTFALFWFFRLQIHAVKTEQATSAALRRSESRLKQLLRDRERISRDLHDGTIQSLYAVGLGLSQWRRTMSSESERQRLTASLLELENVVSELRGYLVEFDPGVSIIQTPAEALSELVQRLQQTTAVPIHFVTTLPEDHPWLGALVLDLLHMAREGIGNALRHGRATEIRLRLQALPNQEVELAIEDNGVGFDPSASRARGRGLQNLHLRTRVWNGRVHLTSKPGGPTCLRLQFSPHAPSVNPSDL